MTTAARVVISLPVSDREALDQLAESEERTPSQQAAYLVRLALANLNREPSPSTPCMLRTSDTNTTRAE